MNWLQTKNTIQKHTTHIKLIQLNKYTQPTFYYILTYIIFALIINQSLCTFGPLSQTSQASTTYTLALESLITAPSGTTIKIIMPTQFSAQALYKNQPYLHPASLSDFCPVDCSAVTISYEAYTFTLGNMFQFDDFIIFEFSIGNIVNPMAVTTNDFIVQVVAPNGTIILTQTPTGFTYTPPTLSLTSSITLTQILSITPLILTINPVYLNIEYIQISFPSKWPNQLISSTTLTDPVTCSSSTHPSLFCTRISQQLKILNLNPTYSQVSSPIVVRINSIKNPSSVRSMTILKISTYNFEGIVLEEITNYDVSGVTKSTLRNANVSIVNVTTSTCTIKVQVNLPRVSNKDDKLVISLPPEISFSNSVALIVMNDLGVVNSPNATANTTFQTITVTPFNSSVTINFPKITVLIFNVVRPHGAIQTSNFTLSTIRNNTSVDTIACCKIKFSPQVTLTATVMSNTTTRLDVNASYVFTININMFLISSDKLIIQFPILSYPNIKNQATCGSLATSTSAPLNNSYSCSFPNSLNNNKLQVANFLQASTSTPHTLILTINGITNPTSPSTPSFTIYTMSSQPIQINSVNSTTINIVSAMIMSFIVSSSSNVVGQRGITLNFVVGGISSLSSGNKIQINIPTDIILNDNAATTCKVNNIVMPCYKYTTNSLLINVNGTSIGKLISLSIANLMNPKSLKPTSIFSLLITDSALVLLQQTHPSLATTLTLNTTNQFSSIYSQPNYILFSSNQSQIKIIIVSPFTLPSPFSILMRFSDTSYKYTISQLSCIHTYIVFNCIFTQNSTGLYLSISNINLNNNVSNTDYFQFKINNLLQIDSNQWISVQMFDSNNYLSLFSNVSSSDISSHIIDYNLTQTNYILSTISQVTITYTLPSYIILNSTISLTKIIVNVPEQYSPNTPIIFNTIPSNNTIKFNITNPSVPSSSPWRISLFSSTILVGISQTQTQFSLICSQKCRTCSPTNTSLCLSCYSSGLSTYYIYDNVTFQCLDQCQSYLFTNSTTTSTYCLPCSSTCVKCLSTDPNKCLSCQSNFYLFQSNSSCLLNCPLTFYPSTNTSNLCLQCHPSCLNCSSLSNCYSCQPTFLLYQANCLSSCPLRTFSFNSSCLPCGTNCLQCNILACLSCLSPYFLSSGTCQLNCPISLLPSLSGICSPCDCNSCSISSYNCTTCFSLSIKKYWYNYRCLGVCPDGMFGDLTTLNICTSCSSGCLVCTSASICIRCIEGYAYSASQCVLNCTNNTIKVMLANTSISSIPSSSEICLACTSPCLTCQNRITFCTSCQATHLLHNNTCVLSCPSPFKPFPPLCLQCAPECLQCLANDSTSCTQCKPLLYLKSSACYLTCPAKSYPELSSKICGDCPSKCSTCFSASICTSCVAGYYLYLDNCYNTCPKIPNITYQYQGFCVQCQRQCVSCISSPIQCTACSSSEYLYNRITFECTFSCVQPYYLNANNTECISCSPPCLTCDHTFNSCSNCNSSLHVLHFGQCISSCPFGYYKNTTLNKCLKCARPCLECTQLKCTSCQLYAYIYYGQCVLDCPADLPFKGNGYCTQCISIPYCTICGNPKVGCYQCSNPYVLFFGNCLNQCPQNYTSQEVISPKNPSFTSRQCVILASYQSYLSELRKTNEPKVPPMFFIIIWILVVIFASLASQFLYKYTYIIGLMLGCSGIFHVPMLVYFLITVKTNYLGETIILQIQLGKTIPLYILLSAIALSILISIIYLMLVVRNIYMRDVRYIQWKKQNPLGFLFAIISVLLFGCRSHKFFYSKFLGKDIFSFRIVSVSKFYEEDVIVLFQCLSDVIYLFGMGVIVYNSPTTYNVLFIGGVEVCLFKVILWILIAFDLRKPDRGFFKGDEEAAELQIQLQEEEQLRKMQRNDTQNLIKLIRTKSAGQFFMVRQYQVDKQDFISVYDPNDYEDVIVVPNKKIEKNIYRGKFRKGKKITIQEKLKRFADSLKPMPNITKTQDVYLRKLLYWKPPKALRVKPKVYVPPSQESMLHLLQQKQLQYQDELSKIQHYQQHKKPNQNQRSRYNQHNFLDDLDQTIPNQTIEHFYPSISKQQHQSLQYQDLLNRNYARKKHLQNKIKQEDQYLQIREIHHQPRRKRNRQIKSKERKLSSKQKPKQQSMYGTMAQFGNMALRNKF